MTSQPLDVVVYQRPDGIQVRVSRGDKSVSDTMIVGEHERLPLDEADRPHGQFWWLMRLERLGDIGTHHEAIAAFEAIMRKFLEHAGGQPILTQCRAGIARVIRVLMRRLFTGYQVDVLRGSLRRDNPYESLTYPSKDGGDDHVISIKRV